MVTVFLDGGAQADSSSVHDTSVHQPLLTIKPQQNLIIDLTPFVYEPYMLYVVECLKYSPLVDALTKVEVVPMSCLSLVYSTAYYDKIHERIHFEIHNEKTSISKHRFCALIGLSQDQSLVNPESITTGQLFSIWDIPKPLPPSQSSRSPAFLLNGMAFSRCFSKDSLSEALAQMVQASFKGLSERSAGSDGASKFFMTVLYGLYHGINLDFRTIIWQQLVQSLVSSSRHSEILCGRFWTIITNWEMDRLHVPIMANSRLSSISTFHTTKIIVTNPTKYSFIGSIPEAMLAPISASSNVLQQYRKHPSSGPRELTPAMVRSIDKADKPAKRGKKLETQKEAQVSKPTKAKTPLKRKSDRAVTSPPKPKKLKKPARRLILQSSSDSDSEYVPPQHKVASPSEFESESSDDEASGQGDTLPRSPTPEIPVCSNPPSPPLVTIPVSIPPIFPILTTQPFTIIPIPTPIFTDTTTTTTGGEDLKFDSTYFSPYRVQSDDDDDEPVTKCHLKAVNEKLGQLLSSSTSGTYSEAALKALFSSVVTEHSAALSSIAKAIEASTSQCQQASITIDALTKECKEATAKVDKLVSEAHLFLDSLQAFAARNAQTVNASVENLQRSLQSERSNLEAARQAIEAANAYLHANAELAVENRIMDELDRRTSQLKMQNLKPRTATTELNDLNSEKEVVRSLVADVHSILLHLVEAHDPIITITTRRHLADKLRPTLDILSRIEGVLVTGVQSKQGGEKSTQPPTKPKPSSESKGNETSVSNKGKKKKNSGEDDTNDEDDVYAENPKNPFQKTKLSEKELEENLKKQ
uniref:Uncharacterized protein n=1 Tax=Lactuca sativa TaxID=4236 RepID=A0A9R1WAK1_LACSA|nr:hypothetical protein LSAT_V11C200056640 [Lactuca sativa]